MLNKFGMLCLLGAALFAEPVKSGVYKGKWEGGSGSAGDIRVALTEASGKWSGDVAFTMGGQEVKCTVMSVQVDGGKLRMVYQFDLQGNALQSAIEGDMSNGSLAGKYKTSVKEGGAAVDEGTWSAASN